MTTYDKGEQQLLLCYYGDDFTGSTDSMEGLALSGLKTVLFLRPPEKELIKERFSDIQCFGVAGATRAMPPNEMEDVLRPIFSKLREFQPSIVHYKVCSTFDSSPEVGSIGRVIDIGKEMFDSSKVIPLLVGAPTLKRFTIFGNHFATVGEDTFRLDRHPTMAKHPTTPMTESDLRLHLSKQTESSIELMDIFDLDGTQEQYKERYIKRLDSKPDVILFDVLDQQRLKAAGQLIWEESQSGPLFVVGSSGVQYALTSYWQENRLIDIGDRTHLRADQVNQLLVVSGSCSPVTQGQIEWSLANGFTGLKVPVKRLIDPETTEITRRHLFSDAVSIINQGKSLVIYSSLGPDDPSIDETKELLLLKGINPSKTASLLGEQLGVLTRDILKATRLRRLVIAGGDTSSYAMQQLSIYALEMIAPIAPGSPLCKSYSDEREFDGLEVALKGGQVGKVNFFESVLAGNEQD